MESIRKLISIGRKPYQSGCVASRKSLRAVPKLERRPLLRSELVGHILEIASLGVLRGVGHSF